jgi:hypothetical protein
LRSIDAASATPKKRSVLTKIKTEKLSSEQNSRALTPCPLNFVE